MYFGENIRILFESQGDIPLHGEGSHNERWIGQQAEELEKCGQLVHKQHNGQIPQYDGQNKLFCVIELF